MTIKETILKNVEIVDISATGKAVAKSEGKVIFVQHAIPGDVIDIKIYRKKSSYFEGGVLTFHKKSEFRVQPFCGHFGTCGGCKWQNIEYKTQLLFKQKQITDAFKKIAGKEVKNILSIVTSEHTQYYRNKLEFTFSNNRWLNSDELNEVAPTGNKNALGFHIAGRHDKVLDINTCYLQPEPSNAIRQEIRKYALRNKLNFYDVRQNKGLLRNLIIRTSSTGDLMVIVIFNCQDQTDVEESNKLLQHISVCFPQISSLLFINNPKLNDSFYDLNVNVFKGNDHIMEMVDGIKYKIGAKSFFQTNTLQAFNIYKTTLEFAELTTNQIVYDLYTGTGAIALQLAGKAMKVVGIDNIPAAIENAKENAQINTITNTLFFSGEVEQILNEHFISQYGMPDVIVTDPPRTGMHKNVIRQLLQILPPKIVYVSCNPATQARDIALLSEKYEIEKMQAVDMFPHTRHVENIALLKRIDF